MFSKKVLVACYIYSFDYSKESLELNELMFRSVPVKNDGESTFYLVLAIVKISVYLYRKMILRKS